jgi:transposase
VTGTPGLWRALASRWTGGAPCSRCVKTRTTREPAHAQAGLAAGLAAAPDRRGDLVRGPDGVRLAVPARRLPAVADLAAAGITRKKANGRERHIAVDAMGLLLAVVITAASVQDRDAARPLLWNLRRTSRHVRLIWADAVYTVLPRRWVVKRTFAWISKHRRTVRDYERLPASHEAMILWAMIVLMTCRLAVPYPVSRPCLTDSGPLRPGSRLRRPAAVRPAEISWLAGAGFTGRRAGRY